MSKACGPVDRRWNYSSSDVKCKPSRTYTRINLYSRMLNFELYMSFTGHGILFFLFISPHPIKNIKHPHFPDHTYTVAGFGPRSPGMSPLWLHSLFLFLFSVLQPPASLLLSAHAGPVPALGPVSCCFFFPDHFLLPPDVPMVDSLLLNLFGNKVKCCLFMGSSHCPPNQWAVK